MIWFPSKTFVCCFPWENTLDVEENCHDCFLEVLCAESQKQRWSSSSWNCWEWPWTWHQGTLSLSLWTRVSFCIQSSYHSGTRARLLDVKPTHFFHSTTSNASQLPGIWSSNWLAHSSVQNMLCSDHVKWVSLPRFIRLFHSLIWDMFLPVFSLFTGELVTKSLLRWHLFGKDNVPCFFCNTRSECMFVYLTTSYDTFAVFR